MGIEPRTSHFMDLGEVGLIHIAERHGVPG